MMLKFSERFKEAREYFGMNKSEFAKKLKKSPTTITRYEDGSIDITVGAIDDVAEKLGISLPWLLGLSDNMWEFEVPYRSIPVLGKIKSKPVMGLENFEGFEILKDNYKADFCIKNQKGTTFFRRQGAAENGDIIAAARGNDILIGKYFRQGKYAMLITEDEKPVDIPLDDAHIIGKAVYVFSEVQ